MIRKTLAILLIIIVIAFGINEFNNHIQHINNLDKFSNYLFSQTDSMLRQNKITIEATQKLLNTSPENRALIQKICKAIVEDGNSEFEVAESYNCLAQLDLLDNNIYSAIKNTSYALETLYHSKYADNLNAMLSNDSHKLYRQSLINLFGRTSSLETPNYNLELAAKLHRQAFDQVNSKQRKTIDVAFALNEKYLAFAKTTIASILLNADLDSDYHFYIITDPLDPITDKAKAELQNLQHIQPYKLEFRAFPNGIIPDTDAFKAVQPQLLLFKALLENIFPELQKLIVLDVDIIVQRDLYDLQNQADFDNFILAASLEEQNLTETECSFAYGYINSGVMLQNLEMMRKNHNTQAILDQINHISNCMTHPEQNLINLLYHDKIKHISRRWNALTTTDNYNTNFMPFIIHYAGAKPWAPRYKASPPAHIKLYQSYWDLAN